MTIHKSKGMTIPALEIDCKHATNPGQIGVPVGRAESTDGLRVVNYRPTICKNHPDSVYVFYHNMHASKSVNTDFSPDYSCCRQAEDKSGNLLVLSSRIVVG